MSLIECSEESVMKGQSTLTLRHGREPPQCDAGGFNVMLCMWLFATN